MEMFNYFFFPIIIIFSASLGMILTPEWSIAPFILILVIVPVIDWLLPKIPKTNSEKNNTKIYQIILILILPLLLILISSALFFTLETGSQLTAVSLGAAIGMATGSVGLPAAHEMIHRSNKKIQNIGLIILLICFYGHFKIEHIHGHHSKVATAGDPATARFGENLYSFLVRCIISSWISGWKIESKLLQKRGKSSASISNRMLIYSSLQAFYLVSIFLAFDMLGILFIVTHTVIAVFLLETVEYIQHYGLQRTSRPTGGIEPYSKVHAWNCYRSATNWSTFNLGLHSEHHDQPNVEFNLLSNQEQYFEMPTSYPLMILLALLPPLWFKVIHRVLKTN